MIITTRLTVDRDGKVLEHEWYEYSSDVSYCKGGNSKAEMQSANQLRQQEFDLMQQQLSNQMSQINAVNSVLDPIIKAGGMTPGEESAMTSIGINQLPQDFRQLEGQLQNRLVARGVSGGQMAGSGDIARNFGQLGAMEDFMKSQVLTNVQLQKANLLRQALGAKMGVAGMFGQNVGGFNQGALSALGIGQQAAKAADEATTNMWGSILGAAGSIGGAALGPHPR